MAWTNLERYLNSLEREGDLLRITRPVDVELEAGGIADLLVKTGGPAVIFEQPRLPCGEISDVNITCKNQTKTIWKLIVIAIYELNFGGGSDITFKLDYS